MSFQTDNIIKKCFGQNLISFQSATNCNSKNDRKNLFFDKSEIAKVLTSFNGFQLCILDLDIVQVLKTSSVNRIFHVLN